MLVCTSVCAHAQKKGPEEPVRYVRMKADGGSYLNNGKSWDKAKDKVQDAINDLRDYMQQNGLTSGSVYIAAGEYVPTESTESSGGSMLNTSFKIYAGIHVYGGFNPDSLESKPGDRIMSNGKKVSDNWADQSGIGTTSGTEIASQWDLKYKTILSGNHATTPVTFEFDSIHSRFNTAFPASSYHVVWFATNGTFDTGTNDTIAGHYKPLDYPASLDGCVITSGNASTRNTTAREHTAYGGGVYMVGNSSMRACTIEKCNATMRGGGIYADGGGEIEFCYIHTCQSTGVGVYQGYGGGVCIDYDGVLGHSHVTNCAARCGGGLTIVHMADEYPERQRDTVISHYSPYTSASVINNNTAAAEGGGIYLAEGGTVNHATVTANICTGPDVTYYGRRHGRTGGIYIRNCGMIFNSVFWGNRCATNNDIQFATVQQRTITPIAGDKQEVLVYHSAFMNHDISDWTGATKEMVFTLEKNNMPKEGSHGNFPCFFSPTVDPTNWNLHDHEKGLTTPGVFRHIHPDSIIKHYGPRIWHLTSYSAIDQKGVQVSEAVQNVSRWLVHAHTEYGVVSNPYEPSSTLGGLVRKPDPIVYSLIKPQGKEGRIGPDKDKPIPTLFIDPNRKGVFEDGVFVPQDREGNSWDTPIRDLGEAVDYFRKRFIDIPSDPNYRGYRMPKLDSEGFPTEEDTVYRAVQFLIKPGELTTVGPGNYVNKNLRSAAIVTYGHMRFYGGYPGDLDTTNTEGRNPRTYRSRIRANVTGISGAAGYENNSAHLFALVNADSVIIDGFMLEDANTHNVYGGLASNDGGGIVVNNSTIDDTLRIDMVGNEVRNCVINNCASPKGAGIYVNGQWKKDKDRGYETCYAELKLVNTIVRNNTSADSLRADSANLGGIVTANGRAFIYLDHCDVVNNAGIALLADNTPTATTTKALLPHRGYIRMDNSIMYCNGDSVKTDRVNIKKVKSVNAAGQGRIFGSYNMFDADLDAHVQNNQQPYGFFQDGYTVEDYSKFIENLPSDVATSFTNNVTGIPSDSAARHNKCIFTRVSITDVNYPSFVNPSRNVGHSMTGDKPLYGGIVAYSPLNDNPMVNAANPEGRDPLDNFDRSDAVARDRGGAPDLGAIEDYNLPAAGEVIYVTEDGAGRRDGSSWDNAIAGNTVYMLSGVEGPDLAAGDSIDEANGARVVKKADSTAVLTTDVKYQGGWGKVWMHSHTIRTTTSGATYHDFVTEKNYYYGESEDSVITVKDHIEETTVWSDGTHSEPSSTFSEGYHYDPRYPYGEISGASRSFWRANPYHSGVDWNNGKDYANKDAFIAACNTNGWINNTRTEKYVSGLQYAVEKASATNKTHHKDSVQVWVGAGEYTDYKGYVMRDSVSVYGGFPYGKYTSPGMTERHALMSAGIDIPKALDAKDYNPDDYETILQISDINPILNNSTINASAMKFQDNDIDFKEDITASGNLTFNRTITHVYEWSEGGGDEDVTTTYITPVNFFGTSAVLKKDSVDEDNNHFLCFGDSTAVKDCWHLTYTGDASPTGTSTGVIGRDNEYHMSGNSNVNDIYDKDINLGKTNKQRLFIRNGSLAGVKVWQDLKNVPAGYYKVVVDLTAYYRTGGTVNYNLPTGVKFIIKDANEFAVVDTAISAYHRKGANMQNNLARGELSRYTFTFNQPDTGTLSIRLEVGAFDSGKGTNREASLDNLKLYRVIPSGYVNTSNTDERVIVDDSEGSYTSGAYSSTNQNYRKTLRKRVLTMPDVCVPTYGAGSVGDPAGSRGKFTDDLSHTHRVTGPTKSKRTSWKNASFVNEDPHYVEYANVVWDGFTIRHGFLSEEGMGHGGGAGVNIYEGVQLKNCIVTKNFSYCGRVKGGGIYCDGATSSIEGCFVLGNVCNKGTGTTEQNQIFSGGMFLYEGTCFNSLFANNYSWGSSGGVGFCVGKFYNNTIAYNTCALTESGHLNGGAISVATESTPNLFVANTIVYGNNGMAIRERTESQYQGVDLAHPFLNCYIQTDVAFTQETYKNNIKNYSEDASYFGKGNILLESTPSAATTPFAADFDEKGNYVAGRAASLNDFRLRDNVPCVNKGTEDFAGDLLDVLLRKYGESESDTKEMPIYKSVKTTQLPDNDVAFADRVQDCQVDIGAYEYNAAYSIQPDTVTHPGKAIYYVTFASPGGDASAKSPANAACKEKLQMILDAAGRYKYKLMSDEAYYTPRVNYPDSTWSVEVWMQGDSLHSTRYSDSDSCEHYTATRSTKSEMPGYHDNTLDYSFIVPRGITVKGGYTDNFYHYAKANGDTVLLNSSGQILTDTAGVTWYYRNGSGNVVTYSPKKQFSLFDDRDPLTFRSILSGKITSSTGADGQTYHVVTFTEDLFDENQNKIGEEGGQLAELNDMKGPEKQRAVLDGLFIMDGQANAPDDEDRIGAAAVVPAYAHIRNCVIQNNTAEGNGGGLYLKPFALVSGTIIKNNSADIGGGIYAESPAVVNNDSLAHVYTTTICENSAVSSAGGIWFDNTYIRVNSSALWHNEASDNANVAGTFSRSSANTDYPFNFSGVESRRLEGQSNIELSPTMTEGVRWDTYDPFHSVLYYPITLSSTLGRAGMTYDEWKKVIEKFPSIDTIDIAGVHRAKWDSAGVHRYYNWNDTLVIKDNDFIDIGARALNNTFEVNVDEDYVMHRLYVMHTDLLNTEAALVLQNNPLAMTNDTARMYSQMGSCILNPFHRLGDALDYIIATRKSDPAKYRGVRFEVFVEKGIYYPYHNAYGQQDQVRTNTFLIPEATTIIGGINSENAEANRHSYGQEGYFDKFSMIDTIGGGDDFTIPGTPYTINFSLTDSIRKRDKNHRPMQDINLNSVIEPWELARQTVLSGNTVAGDASTNVYHVITIHADSTKIGPQPIKYEMANPRANWAAGDPILKIPIAMTDTDQFKNECDLSILARTVELDGIQITGGYANWLHASDTVDHHYQTKTYFRGGGILVDGNWTKDFNKEEDNSSPTVTVPAPYNIPILVQNCFFYDNMAANGGAIFSNGGIYLYGSHFTQNYSQGPMTPLDQKFIPWSAGGCIATNAFCGLTNTLFANNEAMRGMYPILKESAEGIPDADARQGFGGVLSVAKDASLRMVNCQFMKNKAVAYSSVYNFLPNNHYSTADSMQFAFNTIFWGNEVYDVNSIADLPDSVPPTQESIDAFNTKYKASRAGVFHYDGDVWDRYEKLFHEYDSLYRYYSTNIPDGHSHPDTFNVKVINKLKELRQVGDSMEGMYFCSYRLTYGPRGMKPTKEGYLLTREEKQAFVDPRIKPVLKPEGAHGAQANFDTLFTYLHGNNNTLINRVNTATDGPNFKQPTFVAGIDGYMQNADWLPARMNLTTDQGWGSLKQRVYRGVGYYLTRYTGKTHYDTFDEALAAARAAKSDTCTAWSVLPVEGLPVATFDGVDQSASQALYNFYASSFSVYTGESHTPMPIGDQYYMTYTSGTNNAETTGVMDRISRNPRMGDSIVYIDLGIYEYQNVQLNIEGQEIDTMWVATQDRGDHDGTSWEHATSDLQWAIDMLMSSHNGHDKYVCMSGDDEGFYAPNNVIDNRLAYVITSNSLAPLLPDSAEAGKDYDVKSLNFIGGYSPTVVDAPRDPTTNPTRISMPDDGNKDRLNQLFIVEDMTRQLVQANWQGFYTSRDSVVIPITFDGITFINPYSKKDPDSEMGEGGLMSKKGGAAIYYRWQRQYESAGGSFAPNPNIALHPDSALIDGVKVTLPKLTISNCIFMENGDTTVTYPERSSAVRIDHGGGSSLIVNSLFHSNAGDPIFAEDKSNTEENREVPNDVIVVNTTSALNGGHMTMFSKGSEVHNSLIWLDDLANDTTVQLEMVNTAGTDTILWDKSTDDMRNKAMADRVTNNAIWGHYTVADSTNHNDILVTDNDAVFEGPRFIDPKPDADTVTEIEARDFRLKPGARTMNMADTTLYRSKVFFRTYPDESGDEYYWRRPDGFKSDTIYTLKNDLDLATKPRLYGEGMERGAYECRAVLQRVVYVDPYKSAEMAGDGSSWGEPFGHGQLQNAIDVAAIYTYLRGAADDETRKAYVFVKASQPGAQEGHIIARDGVLVFGGIPSTFMNEAYVFEELDDTEYRNSECRRFSNYVRAMREGVASSFATPTRINSLQVGGEDFRTGFVFDGFVFTNPDSTEALVNSPLKLENPQSIVRNCLFTGNRMQGETPVAWVRNGLLYNSLLYGDTAEVEVRVGGEGLLLNTTIVASRETDEPLSVNEASRAAGAVQNTIAVRAGTADMNTFAPYMTQNNPYTLPSFYTTDRALAYQLHEHSKNINVGKDTAELPDIFDFHTRMKGVDFSRDRDVLGNPRKIGTKVDNGAMEAWLVEPNKTIQLTTLTDKYITKGEAQTAGGGADKGEEGRRTAFIRNYGGNFYPHGGSVVYLMDSSAMTMQYETDGDFRDFTNQDIPLRVGYMLLKPGASLYGNGHTIHLRYLAAEKRFTDQRYAMTAFPFPYKTSNILMTSYDNEADAQTYTLAPVTFDTYLYDGVARSAKDYNFQTANSTLWHRVDTVNRTATQGYLMDFGRTISDTTLRFVAFAAENGQYVYREDGEVDKIVSLKQYDNRTPGSGAELDFTRQEDMGWNMKGLPWLVSDYRTDTILEEDNYQRQMFIPHVLYQMNGAGEYIHYMPGDKIYSSRSWDRGSKVSMGNAFFTQTATTKEAESVYFHLPYYAKNDKVGRPMLAIRGDRSSADILTIMPDSTVSKDVRYTFGRDAIKWLTADKAIQMYLLDSKRMSRISLLGAAPTEVDIPLGVKAPAEMDYTFSLPEKEAFSDYGYVWLIDYMLNRFTNLLEEDYTVALPAGENNTRFAVRIGGYPKTDDKGRRQYVVFAYDGTLYVRGLVAGDRITVYAPSGQLITHATATSTEWSTPLYYQSGYVVKVNDRAYKVLNN